MSHDQSDITFIHVFTTQQHTSDEYNETVEFAEIERQTLLETNKELEAEVSHLRGNMLYCIMYILVISRSIT